MKNTAAISLGLGFIVLALVALGLFVVRPVLAQVVATSTELLLGTTTPAETLPPEVASTTEATVTSTSTPTSEVAATNATVPTEPTVLGESTAAATEPTSAPPPPTDAASAAESAASSGLVEVQLECSMSYTGSLYDTPSGHLDEGYFIGEAAASTTGMIAAHEIGTQAWTVCNDDEGNTYEFKITVEEYDSYKIRGTPKKSVMKPAPVSTPAPVADPATAPTSVPSSATPTPQVLSASTSTDPAASPSTADAQPSAEQGTSTTSPQ